MNNNSSVAVVEEWLKQANQNKINSKNSFNVQLIDYFYSLSKEKSVNFLQVSYTLDGCVKVYTSRVDAVNKESEDLLQGLISSSSGLKGVVKKDSEDSVVIKTTTSTKKSSSVVVKEDAIRLKKFELIPSSLSDPCFVKITTHSNCKKDETIVDKLLMNQLELNQQMEYILDSKIYYPLSSNKEDVVGVSTTSSSIDLDSILKNISTTTTSSSICPALKHFDFTKRDNTFETVISTSTTTTTTDDDDEEVIYDDEFVYVEPMPDLMMMMEQQDDDEDSVGEEEDCIGFEEEQIGGDYVDTVNVHPTTKMTKMTVSRNDYDLHLFSSNSKKNWAGPSHFKLTRILQQGLLSTTTSTSDGRKKNAATEFRIDFFSSSSSTTTDGDKLTEDVLFKKTVNSSSCKLSNTTILLPVDLHYGYDDVRRMFLKPKFKVGYQEDEQKEEGVEMEDYVHDDDDDDDHYPNHFEEEEEDGDTAAVPFESLQFTQSQQSLIEEDKGLNYSKRAKRVDVKKLKDTLWQDIQQFDKEVSFKKVLEQTPLKHTTEKENEITVSYYFICLLHLCNEKEIELEGNVLESDLKLIVSS